APPVSHLLICGTMQTLVRNREHAPACFPADLPRRRGVSPGRGGRRQRAGAAAARPRAARVRDRIVDFAAERPLRVVSYNIHKGFGPGNWSFTLLRIAAAIRTLDADLVFL